MMRRLAAAGAAIAIALAGTPSRADERGREVEAFMREYLTLWNAHDAKTIHDRIYRLDSANRMSTQEGLQATFDGLKAQGYDHSDLVSLNACMISEVQSVVEFRFKRLKADGSPVPPGDYASLYMVRKYPDGWRINSINGMNPTAHVTCSSYR